MCQTLDETLSNFIKKKTQQMGKRRNKKRGPKSNQKKQNPKWDSVYYEV